MKTKILYFLSLTVILTVYFYNNAEAKVIQKGDKVTFEYVLTIGETSNAKTRQVYQHGQGQIFPELEKNLARLEVGDEKTVVLSPEQSFGKLNPNAFYEIPLQEVPETVTLQEGQIVSMNNKLGQQFPVSIIEIREDTVVFNLNHPLAGKELRFDIKILDVE